jgi:hypothetical protein
MRKKAIDEVSRRKQEVEKLRRTRRGQEKGNKEQGNKRRRRTEQRGRRRSNYLDESLQRRDGLGLNKCAPESKTIKWSKV